MAYLTYQNYQRLNIYFYNETSHNPGPHTTSILVQLIISGNAGISHAEIDWISSYLPYFRRLGIRN